MTANPKHSSASVEHYTPANVIARARTLMGGIDLDPASCSVANRTVKAATIFTQKDDGLAFTWAGRVWLNPPGGTERGKSRAKLWWKKLLDEYQFGAVTEAVFCAFSLEFLQNAQSLRHQGVPVPGDFPICIPEERIAFEIAREPVTSGLFASSAPDDVEVVAGEDPTHANALIYLPPMDWREPSAARDAWLKFSSFFGGLGMCLPGRHV